MADEVTAGRKVPLSAASGGRSYPMEFLRVGDWFEVELGTPVAGEEWRVGDALRGTVANWCQRKGPGKQFEITEVGRGVKLAPSGVEMPCVTWRVLRMK